MPHIPRRPSPRALCFCALVLVLALAGAAWAAIPGPEGIIHGCYSRSTGSLRVINTSVHAKCTRKEHELNWAEQGPAGPRGGGGAKGATGPRGSTGAAGASGPPGPSNAFAGTQTGELELSPARQVLTSIALAPGKYMFEASATIAEARGSHEAAEASCVLAGTPTPAGEAHANATLPGEEGAAQTIPLDGAFTLTGDDTIELACSRSSGTVSASHGQIDAIEVGAINGS